MFGYVVTNNEELKIKDYNFYRSCYCGLCRTLKQRHGLIAPMTLSYDMTFVVILMSALYEDPFVEGSSRCIMHPAKKHPTRINKWTEYAADMTILMAYHNMLDDWEDEKKAGHLAIAKTLSKSYKKICEKYPAQAQAIKTFMNQTKECESAGDIDLDRISGYTGTFLGTLFAKEEDIWNEHLYKIGFYLGKFIYLMDAYDDLEKDQKKGNYNPLISLSKKRDFEAFIENTLVMMMAECSKNFEQLPILQYTEILRNILYSGVWTKFNIIQKQKEKKYKKEQTKQKGNTSDEF